MPEFEDYYEILQVHPSAEPEVIKAAYQRLAQKYHPDVNKDPAASDRMKRINRAYEVLSQSEKRQEYYAEWLRNNGMPAGSGTEPVEEQAAQHGVKVKVYPTDHGSPSAGKYNRRHKLWRLHWALVLWLLPAFAGMPLFLVGVALWQGDTDWVTDNVLMGYWFLSLVSLPSFVVGDHIWSIGANKPAPDAKRDDEYNWWWLALGLFHLVVGPICFIIAVVAYLRGLAAIRKEQRQSYVR